MARIGQVIDNKGGLVLPFSCSTCLFLDAVGAQCPGRCPQVSLDIMRHPVASHLITCHIEIFPSSLRSKGVALSTCSNWLNNFIIVSPCPIYCQAYALLTHFHHCQGLITPPLVHITGYGAYVFFAIFCALSFAWTFLLVPETKGRSLEQMDDVFGDGTSGEEQSRRQEIETALLRTEREGMLTLVKPCELKPLGEEKIILILRGLLMTSALKKTLTCRYRDPATHHPRSSRCWEISINNEISGEARLPVPSR